MADYLLPDDISKYDKGEGKTLIVYTADKNEKGDVYTCLLYTSGAVPAKAR